MLGTILNIESWKKQVILFQKQEIPEGQKIYPLSCRLEHKWFEHGRRQVPYFRDDFDEVVSTHSVSQRLLAPSKEIMFGGVGDCIDKFGLMDRILYEADQFIAVSGPIPSLFKMKDEIGDPSIVGLDLDAQEPFNSEKYLARMISEQKDSSWSTLKRLQHLVEQKETAWQSYVPVISRYLSDILPNYPMEETSTVLLEPEGQVIQIPVPKSESRMVVLLSGEATLFILKDHEYERKILASPNQFTEIDGPCFIILEPTEDMETDSLLVIGRPVINPEKMMPGDDMLIRAVQSPRGYEDSLLFSDEEEDEDQDSENIGVRSTQTYSGILPDISSLGDELPSDLSEQALLWHKETAGTIPMDQWRVRKKLKKLDDELTTRLDSAYLGHGYVPPSVRWERIVEEELSAPTEAAEARAEIVQALLRSAKKITSLQELQQFRTKIFPLNQTDKKLVNTWSHKSTNKKISALDSAKEVFQHVLITQRVQKIRCNICGTIFVHMPKYQTFLKAYQQALTGTSSDPLPMEPIHCWKNHYQMRSIIPEEKWYTVLVDEPITAVTMFKKGKEGTPENLLDRKVWYWFDRRRETSPGTSKYRLKCNYCKTVQDHICTTGTVSSILCLHCGKEGSFEIKRSKQVKPPRFQEDSRWWRDRTKAFQDLNATQTQWNNIYKQLWIQHDRIQQCYLLQNVRDVKPSVQERRADWKAQRDLIWDALKASWKTCLTLSDVRIFETAIYQQVIATKSSEHYQAGDIIKCSPIDRLTFGDEAKIRHAISRKRLEIAADRAMSSKISLLSADRCINIQIACSNDTCERICIGREEIESWCYQCNRPTSGKPQFIKVEENTGVLFLECQNPSCKSRVAIGSIDGLFHLNGTCCK